MHAALITGKETVELVEFDEPTPANEGVVVDISLCGICGTDIHAWQSGSPYNPAICGHEWVGLVSAAGHEVTSVFEGDRVLVAVPPACGTCAPCRAGHTAVCDTVFAHATGRHPSAPAHGGFAPSIAVAADRVLGVAAEISDTEAAQIEPLTVTLHAIRRAAPRPGDVAVVQGAGPIGLLTSQLAKLSGAGSTIVVEPNEARRQLALDLGADHAVGPDDAAEFVMTETGGLGADIVYECAGVPSTIQTAVNLTRRQGRMCLIGLASGTAEINPAIWLVKEVTVTTALAYTHEEFAMAQSLVADGRVQLDPLHSRTVGLTDLNDAIGDLSSGAGDMKILVDPRLS